jgi:hypothetical protein
MKCRNIEARDLARRLIKGETVTRDMASSDRVWALVRSSALGVTAAYHAKLMKNGVSAENAGPGFDHQHERIETICGAGRPSWNRRRDSGLPSWLVASLEESAVAA